ncbi:MAG: methyltransferase domain-containing protein [Deltaproteobacteria bacterium]|nr:methyltransferase domain-containing protein [Deltaproteobacteria bacterium]MBW1924261.1 methyltransferase domain-containing protein [Deltaproteobacteria bacterium]
MVTHIEIPNHRFERIACPVCGSGDQRLVISVLYGELKQKKGLDYSAVGIRSDTRLYVKECIECGFVFVNPRIKKEYEDIVYNECKKKMYEKKKALYDPDSSAFLIETRERKFAYVGPLLEAMAHMNLKKKDLVLFDYGCGIGNSMRLGIAFGMDAYGVDIDAKRLDICRRLGLKVAHPDRFDRSFPKIKADIILWQSNIEHVVDPRSAMNYITQKATPGAVLYVNGLTPKVIFLEKKQGLFVKAHFVEHINYFPIRTLDRFAAAFGWRPIHYTNMKILKNLRDVLRTGMAFCAAGVLGHVTYRGYFRRLYRYDGKADGNGI